MQARVTLPCLSDPRDAEGGFADGCLEPVALLQEKVNEIRPGQTTEEDLVRTFGSPATKRVCPEGETFAAESASHRPCPTAVMYLPLQSKLNLLALRKCGRCRR